jgi:hypothetical protein
VIVDGLALLVAGLIAIAGGSAVAKRRVRAEYGVVDAETSERAEEEGIVPGWATALVLLGYLGVIVGVILGIIGLFRG